jgi:hypothetical protein
MGEKCSAHGEIGEDKVVPVLLLTEHYDMKVYWGMEI